jgi:hypothetical protein
VQNGGRLEADPITHNLRLLLAPGYTGFDRPNFIGLKRNAKLLLVLLYTSKSYKSIHSIAVNVTAIKMIKRLCISGENVWEGLLFVG